MEGNKRPTPAQGAEAERFIEAYRAAPYEVRRVVVELLEKGGYLLTASTETR